MTDTATNPEEKKKSSGILGKILAGVGGIALIGIGFGAGMYLGKPAGTPSDEVLKLIERHQQEEAEKAEEEATSGPQKLPKEVSDSHAFRTNYFEFSEPLTTNLKNSRRFLQISIGISTQYDEQVITNIQTHEMAIRSDILAVVSGYTEGEVEGTDGRQKLADDIKRAINLRLEKYEGFGGVEDVFFATFVMQ